MSVFFSSLKNCFKQSRQLLDTSRQLGYLLSPFSFFLLHSRWLLDSFSIHRGSFWMLDSSSIHQAPFAVDTSQHILDSSSIVNSRIFILDSSQHLSIHRETRISIYKVCATFLSFLLDLSR